VPALTVTVPLAVASATIKVSPDDDPGKLRPVVPEQFIVAKGSAVEPVHTKAWSHTVETSVDMVPARLKPVGHAKVRAVESWVIWNVIISPADALASVDEVTFAVSVM
jgi:hypothetical protein